MAKIDRSSLEDAKKVVEKLLPDNNTRKKFINFLANAINFADLIKNDNWNLNLDKNGNFLRFNTGHEYCIQLTKSNLLILCNRITIKPIIIQKNIPVIFLGYIDKNYVQNSNIDKVPDLLFKTKNSVGCIIEHKDIEYYIDCFVQSNKEFIKLAMNTNLTSLMKQAHSKGAVDYIFNNLTNESELHYFNDLLGIEEIQLNKAKQLNQKERLKKISESNKKPDKITVKHVIFQRNTFVVAEALFRANGRCEKCKQLAPFFKDKDNTPYLEVHHIIPLAENGDDTLENVIALCPNCHRQAHYGKKTY